MCVYHFVNVYLMKAALIVYCYELTMNRMTTCGSNCCIVLKDEVGYTSDGSAVHLRVTQIQTILTHIHPNCQFRTNNQPDMDVFGL